MIPPLPRVLGPSGRTRRYRVAGEASSSEADREPLQASQREALAVLRPVRGQRELREPLHERVDGDLALHARERGAEAEVDAQPKAMWRLSARVMSRRSGSGNCAGSRSAAPMNGITSSPLPIDRPPSVTSSLGTRAVRCTGPS